MRVLCSGVFKDGDWSGEEGDFGEGERGDSVIEDGIEEGVAFTSAEIKPGNGAEQVDSAEDGEQNGAEVDFGIEDAALHIVSKSFCGGCVPGVVICG